MVIEVGVTASGITVMSNFMKINNFVNI